MVKFLPKPAGVPVHCLFCKIRANPFYCPDTCESSFDLQSAVPKKKPSISADYSETVTLGMIFAQ